jgi:hypothetical protein
MQMHSELNKGAAVGKSLRNPRDFVRAGGTTEFLMMFHEAGRIGS